MAKWRSAKAESLSTGTRRLAGIVRSAYTEYVAAFASARAYPTPCVDAAEKLPTTNVGLCAARVTSAVFALVPASSVPSTVISLGPVDVVFHSEADTNRALGPT